MNSVIRFLQFRSGKKPASYMPSVNGKTTKNVDSKIDHDFTNRLIVLGIM
jgi:hypothetical protein